MKEAILGKRNSSTRRDSPLACGEEGKDVTSGTDAAIYEEGGAWSHCRSSKGGPTMKSQQWVEGQRNQVVDDVA